MNITAKIVGDEDYKNKYFAKLKELDSQKNMFIDLTKKINESAQKKKKSESKKKKSSDVMVTGATNKSEIIKLQRTLRQKIAEVIADEDDQKLKNIKVNSLQRKLESLERILSQIQQLEREQQQQQAKQHKKKKGLTESVYLTSDDLTVNKSGYAGVDVTVSAMTNVSATPNVSEMINVSAAPSSTELIAQFEAAVNVVI